MLAVIASFVERHYLLERCSWKYDAMFWMPAAMPESVPTADSDSVQKQAAIVVSILLVHGS